MATAPPRTLSTRDLLCLDLYAASRAVIKAYRPFLEPLGLTYPQYLVMVALWEKEPLGVKNLSDQLSLDSGTLSPLLKRLEAAGLVVRKRSREDEREVHVALTKAGRDLKKQFPSVLQGIGCLFDLKPDEMKSLQGLLREIRTRMETADTPAAP